MVVGKGLIWELWTAIKEDAEWMYRCYRSLEFAVRIKFGLYTMLLKSAEACCLAAASQHKVNHWTLETILLFS